MKTIYLLPLLVAVLATAPLYGQKTSFQKAPTDWITPRFDTKDKRLMAGENGNNYHLERFAKLKREAAVHWAVFADRDRTPVYDEASDKTAPAKYASMGDMYRVNAEKGEFFEVFTFSGLDESKETKVGWVHKSNLVLWRRPLTERRTGIDIKAFIVNTQDFLTAKKSSAEIVETKEIYKIYGSPQSIEPIAQGNLYNVLFVFKYDEDSRRYLVSNHYELDGPGKFSGWVDANRVKLWETALAIEPNYSEAAVEERRSNPRFVAQVFRTSPDVIEYQNGSPNKPLIKRDVATSEPELVIRHVVIDSVVHIRYDGSLPRFPLYNVTSNMFECGVVGKLNVGVTGSLIGVTDQRLALAEKKFKAREKSLKNTNVVFVIENGKQMKRYTDRVEDIMERAYKAFNTAERGDFKWGAVVYSDAFCDQLDQAIGHVIPLTDVEDFEMKFKRINHVQTGPRDGLEASMYALMQTMKDVGLNENENNIIVHIANSADRNYELDNETLCPALNPGWSKVWREMAQYGVHYLAVQCYRDGSDYDDLFIETDTRDLIRNVSNALYNEVREKDFYASYSQPNPPKIIEDDRRGFRIDEHAVTLMRAVWPGKNECGGILCMEEGVFMDEAVDHIVKGRRKAQDELKIIQKMYLDNSKLSQMTEAFSGNLGAMFSKLGLSKEEMDVLSAERVQVYQDGFAPSGAKQQKHPMWKYVLFLSEDDVVSIKRDISKVTKAKFSSDVQARRDVISRFWRQMANTVLNMDDDAQDLSSLTVGDIKARLRGLKNQGVSFEGGVLDKLTVAQIETLKNEDLNAYMDEIEAKARFWDDVGSSYPFSYYPAGEGDKRKKFYWIPFEFLY